MTVCGPWRSRSPLLSVLWALTVPCTRATAGAVLAAPCLTIGVAVDATTNVVYLADWTLLGAGNWTIPLTATVSQAGNAAPAALSTTQLIGTDGVTTPLTCSAAAGCVVAANATDAWVRDATHAGFGDSEDWILSVRSPVTPGALCGFTWTVVRRWPAASQPITSSRQALGFVTTGAPPIYGYQIPSWLDPAGAFLNETASGAGFALPLPDGGATWYEYGSVNATQLTRWAPIDVHAVLGFDAQVQPPLLGPCADARGAFFSSAKAPADGTASLMSVGGQTVDRRASAPCSLPAGTTEVTQLWLDVVYNGTHGSSMPPSAAAPQWTGETAGSGGE
jgi:hypothetical protein